MTRHSISILAAACLAAGGCAGTKPAATTPAAAAQSAVAKTAFVLKASPETASAVLAAMDRTADPCEDFYRYACGGWIDRTELPADQNRWVRSFSEITERNRAVLRDILEKAAADPGGDAAAKKLGDFYAACMDEATVDAAGLKPVEPMLSATGTVADAASFLEALGRFHASGVSGLFGFTTVGDFKNPDVTIAYVSQGGLGLPDRDYYLKDDERSKTLRAGYEAHVAKMFALAGASEDAAKKTAASIVAFETELAKVQRPRAELRDPNKTYNKLDLAGLKALTPGLPWESYLAATGHPSIRDINVQVPEFFKGAETLLARTDRETLQAYLQWNVLRSTGNLLSKPFVEENFAFYGKTLGGQKEMQARWKRCVQATDQALPHILGREFVDRQFAGESKEIALDMIGRIEGAFEGNLSGLGWMDTATRTRAEEKKAAIGNKIGYPDQWDDYSAIAISRQGYVGNVFASRKWHFDRDANRIGGPVDRKRFGMSPPTVNAYYTPILNEMVFPAGILQPPFFDRSFPMAMNFGGIGMVMGHELTHGFDDQGRKFDPKGRLSEWWEPEVSAQFEKQTACVSDLYGSYEVQPGVKINGKLTNGENIADLGGLKQAYSAWKAWQKEHAAYGTMIDGLTNDQLFFVAFAQTWCSKASPEQERLQVTTDSHSPARFRVVGPVTNFPVFAETFHCKAGAPMNPEARCTVW